MGISAADFEFLHNIVGAKRCRRGDQKGMDLRHGAIHSPGAADHAPLTHKLVSRLSQSCCAVVSVVHVFSINPENMMSQGI